MALTVEEVEAVLRLRDELSAGLKIAQGNAQSFSGTLEDIRVQSGLTGGGMRDMAVSFIAAQIGMEAITTAGRDLIAFLTSSIQLFTEHDLVSRKMTAALQQQGLALPSVIAQYTELSKKYEGLTTNSDEAILSVEALLTQVGGVLPSQMDAALESVTNLSSGIGKDLNSAAMVVAKAFEDNFKTLKRYGVQIDEARAQSEGMSYVLGAINAKFGGQNQADIESYAGKIKQLGNAFDDFKEEIGKTAADSGLLDTLFVTTKVGLVALGVQFKQTMADLSTMPSFAELFTNPIDAISNSMARSTALMKQWTDEANKAANAAKSPTQTYMVGDIVIQSDEAKLEANLVAQRKYEKEKAAIAEQARADAKAAAKKALDEMKVITGQTMQEDMTALAAVVKSAWEGPFGIAINQFDDLAKKIRVFKDANMELPPVLQDVLDEQQILNEAVGGNGAGVWGNVMTHLTPYVQKMMDLVRVTEMVGEAQRALDKAYDDQFLFSNIPKVSQSSPEFKISIPGINDFRQQIADADAKMLLITEHTKEFQTTLGLAGLLMDAFGHSSNASWNDVIKAGAGAIQIVQQYVGQMGAAKKAIEAATLARQEATTADQIASAQLQMTAASAQAAAAAEAAAASAAMGILGLGLDLWMQAGADEKALNVSIDALEKQLLDLGYSAQWVTQQIIAMNQGAPGLGSGGGFNPTATLNTLLAAAKDRADHLKTAFDGLNTLLQQVGGTASMAMEPLITDLLSSTNLTDQERTLLQSMAARPTWQVMQSDAEKFGISIDDLGASFQQARIGSGFDDIYTAFTHLTEGGAPPNVVLQGMADEVQTLLNSTMQFGTQLPSFMKPMLQSMVQLGLLTDAAGNKLTDLSQFSFTDSIESSFQRMADILEQIRDLLASGIPNAAIVGGSAIRGTFGPPQIPDSGLPGVTGDSRLSVLSASTAPGVLNGSLTPTVLPPLQLTIPVMLNNREVGRAVAELGPEEYRFRNMS